MIKVHISSDAYWAIARDVPAERRLEAQRAPQGGYYLWLDKQTVARLNATRGPREGFSEAILRVAREAA